MSRSVILAPERHIGWTSIVLGQLLPEASESLPLGCGNLWFRHPRNTTIERMYSDRCGEQALTAAEIASWIPRLAGMGSRAGGAEIDSAERIDRTRALEEVKAA